jgi:hypothetical protein
VREKDGNTSSDETTVFVEFRILTDVMAYADLRLQSLSRLEALL